MKTLKQLLMCIIAGLLFTSVYAQEKKKICIKIVNENNGVETKKDTCFKSVDEAEAFVKKNDATGMNVHNIFHPSNGSTPEVFEWHTMNSDSSMAMEKDVKVIVDDNGNVIVNTNDGSEPHIINISNFSDTIINQVDVSESVTSDGKKQVTKTVKVMVIKKIDVSDVSENEKKALSGIITQSKQKLSDLKIGSGEAKLNVSFTSQSNDLVSINVFDINGKTIRTEKEAGLLGHFNKAIFMGDMPTGIYFVQIQQGDKAETKKVVISEGNR